MRIELVWSMLSRSTRICAETSADIYIWTTRNKNKFKLSIRASIEKKINYFYVCTIRIGMNEKNVHVETMNNARCNHSINCYYIFSVCASFLGAVLVYTQHEIYYIDYPSQFSCILFLSSIFMWLLLIGLWRRPLRRAPINLAVLSLIESGQLARLQAKWWNERNVCQYSDIRDTAHNELSLSHVAGLFFILIGGLLLALVVALIEFCFKGRDDGRQRSAGGSRTGGHSHNQTSHVGKQHTDTMKSKPKLSIQSGREYDNGRVGVSCWWNWLKIIEYNVLHSPPLPLISENVALYNNSKSMYVISWTTYFNLSLSKQERFASGMMWTTKNYKSSMFSHPPSSTSA